MLQSVLPKNKKNKKEKKKERKSILHKNTNNKKRKHIYGMQRHTESYANRLIDRRQR